jgi:hypothetical protein
MASRYGTLRAVMTRSPPKALKSSSRRRKKGRKRADQKMIKRLGNPNQKDKSYQIHNSHGSQLEHNKKNW